jgi:hypothetical protein
MIENIMIIAIVAMVILFFALGLLVTVDQMILAFSMTKEQKEKHRQNILKYYSKRRC